MKKKKDFKELITKSITTDNKEFFKYIKSRKLAREAVRSLGDNGIKSVLKEDKEAAEKLNQFFSCLFTAKVMSRYSFANRRGGCAVISIKRNTLQSIY